MRFHPLDLRKTSSVTADIPRAAKYWLDWRAADMKASRSHDEAMIEMLRRDPVFAATYLRTAGDEIRAPGGETAFLAALRQVAQAPDQNFALILILLVTPD